MSETIGKIIGVILVGIICSFTAYGIMSFILWQPSMSHWTIYERFAYVVETIFFVLYWLDALPEWKRS